MNKIHQIHSLHFSQWEVKKCLVDDGVNSKKKWNISLRIFFFTNKEWEILTFLGFFKKNVIKATHIWTNIVKKCIISILNDFPFAKSENPMTFCSCKCQLFFCPLFLKCEGLGCNWLALSKVWQKKECILLKMIEFP